MEKYKRLETLVQILQRRPYRSKRELLDYFENYLDTFVSARTIERDFQILETEFHIEIIYDRMHRGYTLLDEDKEYIANFLRFAGRMYLADLFRKGLKTFEDLQKFIKLENHSTFEGLHLIEPLFLAIRQGRVVTFLHENFLKETKNYYQMIPLQLREYEGRWYVVGIPIKEENSSQIKTFGLDRISNLQTEGLAHFSRTKYVDQLDKFSQIVGLNYGEGESEERIELAVDQTQYKYLRSLPLHPSQVNLEEMPDGRKKISLKLIPNYELKMQLLKLGSHIEVLHPKTLRTEIKKELIKTLKGYQNEK